MRIAYGSPLLLQRGFLPIGGQPVKGSDAAFLPVPEEELAE
jgi:hypothetical protein